MAEPTLNVDPRIYGGNAPTGDAVPEFDPNKVASGTAVANNPQVIADQSEIGAGSVSASVGKAVLAENNRLLASYGEAAKATVKSWATTRVWDAINAPNFTPDPDFDPKPYLSALEFTPTEAEHKFLAGAHSQQEYIFRRDNVTAQRTMYQQMGDHPFLSFALGMADPAYLAIDFASFGVGRIARAAGAGSRLSKVAAGVSSFGGTYALGKVEQQVSAVSDGEVIMNALINGAAAGFTYRAGKRVRIDPEFPADDLTRAVTRVDGAAPGVERRVANEASEVADHPIIQGEARFTKSQRTQHGIDDMADVREDANTYLSRWTNDAEMGPIIKTLQAEQGDALSKLTVQTSDLKNGGRALYHSGSHTVYMPKAGNFFNARTAVHEAIHGLTSHKIDYGLANPGTAHGKIVGELDGLRRELLDQVKSVGGKVDANLKYLSGDLKEFVAGLYSGNTSFTHMLANIQATAGGNSLKRMVTVVRKLLGLPPTQESALTRALGLSDDLMNQKATVKLVPSSADVAAGKTSAISYAPPSGSYGQQAATITNRMESAAKKTGQAISWSLHKTLTGMGEHGRRVADLLVDNPVDMRADSVVSQRTAIRSDLATLQYAYEDALKDALKEAGVGTWQRLIDPRRSVAVQRDIERQVMVELDRRGALSRKGLSTADASVDPRIAKIADAHDAATKAALLERKAAGELGADAVEVQSGYYNRRWSVTNIEDTTNRLVMGGMTEQAARSQVRDLVATAIQRATPGIDGQVASDVAHAILERARRKGYFEDSAFRSHVGNAGAKEIRDVLEGAGVPADRINKALEVVTGVQDEAGKASNLKRRVDMDMAHSIPGPDGQALSVMDLIDHNLTRNLDSYLDNAAGNAALARKGLVTVTDVNALRTEFLHGITDQGVRGEAASLFDDVINSLKGNPVGEHMNDFMRKLSGVTQMVGLSSSGLWQVTEYANAMAKYGLLKTTKEIMRTMPVFKQLMGEAAQHSEAESLSKVLARNSHQDIRMRPFLSKLEDNFDFDMGDTMMLRMQEAKQWVPYINAMRYIHHNQANVVGNLVADTFHKAVQGDTRAIEAVAKYGLEGHTLGSIRSDITRHGLDTTQWSDATWQQIRGPLSKMMDDTVLKTRTGEIPAFAQFSSVGKFIFTFRTFLLASHNKVLAGHLGREGFGGMALLMAYQFPMTMLAAQANSAMRGKPETDPAKLATQAIAQMGSVGLFSELFGIVTGEKQQFGSSGLMAIDRLYKVGSAAAQGNVGGVAAGTLAALPIVSILPGVKAVGEALK